MRKKIALFIWSLLVSGSTWTWLDEEMKKYRADTSAYEFLKGQRECQNMAKNTPKKGVQE